MEICQVFHRDYPWDVRVEKICRSLIRNGCGTHLICNNTRADKSEELRDGVQIHRIGSLGRGRVNRALTYPMFFNPRWIVHISRIVRQNDVGLIIVRDLPLVVAAWIAARKMGIPIIYDMAENYPAMWQNFPSTVKRPAIASVLERVAVRLVDHVFVVVEESKQRLLRKGIEKEKVSVVSNTPEIGVFGAGERTIQACRARNDQVYLLYVGYLTHIRGIDVVIRALPIIRRKYKGVKLVVVGDGAELGNLKRLAMKTGEDANVEFRGWVDFKDVPELMIGCDVGVIPHVVSDHTNTTIPNKLFDFMASGKPVIVSNALPMKRIVEEADCGVVFKSGNAEDFAIRTMEVLKDERARASMGERGREAVESVYNWGRDEERLLRVLERTKAKSAA